MLVPEAGRGANAITEKINELKQLLPFGSERGVFFGFFLGHLLEETGKKGHFLTL